jgi:hypothetical protein
MAALLKERLLMRLLKTTGPDFSGRNVRKQPLGFTDGSPPPYCVHSLPARPGRFRTGRRRNTLGRISFHLLLRISHRVDALLQTERKRQKRWRTCFRQVALFGPSCR